MNVLEKILEEIDAEIQKQRELCKDLKDTPRYRLYEKAAAVFKGIIAKHMDEAANDDGWIPVSKRLPAPDKMVVVTVHCSEWISDYDSVWVPEKQKIHHSEEYLVSMGYVDDLGDWIFFDMDGYEIYCDKEFGTDKGCFYSVVTAWRPFEELGPYKGGE